MNPQQRQTHLRKVATTPATCCSSSSSQATASTPLSLSVDVESVAAAVSVPLPCLQGVWKKATELLNTPQAISSAPGHPDEARMVMSRSGQRPHLVLPCKTRRFKCDSDCMNFKSLGICSHSIAVAELNNEIQAFVAAFTKVKRTPSFTSVTVHGMPAGRGRKGSQAPRKRKQRQPVTEREDRVPSIHCGSKSSFSPSVSGSSNQTQNYTQGSTSQVVSGSSNNTVSIHLDSPTRQFQAGFLSHYPQGPSFTTPVPSYMYCDPPSVPPGTSWMPSHYNWYADFPPPPPPPMAQEAAPFNLCMISGNISKCAGCGNKYGKPPVPPYDLCVQHREWRLFTSPSGGPQSKFSPAYYHVNVLCITRNWPLFSPMNLTISPEMLSKLMPVHKDFLASFGYVV